MPVEAAFQLAGIVLLFVTLIVAAVTDLVHRKVYDWLTYPAIVLGLTLGYAAGDWGSVGLGYGGSGLANNLAGLAVAFGVFFVVYWGRGVGGGDVKLMAAVGAIMGLHFVVGAMFWSALVGAIMAVWVLILKGKLWWGLRRSLRHAVRLGNDPEEAEGEENPARLRIPYGAAIAFGTLVAFFLPVVTGGRPS
jgi:prepilin peptidase CpaA